MTLQELIARLQTIAKSKQQADVTFQFADVDANSCSTRGVHLLEISDAGQDGRCFITVGNYERDAALYKEHLETMKKKRGS